MTTKNAIAEFLSVNKNMTQQQFAKEIGVSQSMVAHFSNGRHDPTPEKALDIEEKFGIDASIISPVIARAREKRIGKRTKRK